METEKRLTNRHHIINSILKYIEESVYYRSFSEEMHGSDPIVLFNLSQETGNILIK